ncbi:hypothetical protein GGF41_007290 [Coemansia sp. RSA 2531]|nr:hypothetical protein GGF41_007290 [Coemansia sp. RSA 2531]
MEEVPYAQWQAAPAREVVVRNIRRGRQPHSAPTVKPVIVHHLRRHYLCRSRWGHRPSRVNHRSVRRADSTVLFLLRPRLRVERHQRWHAVVERPSRALAQPINDFDPGLAANSHDVHDARVRLRLPRTDISLSRRATNAIHNLPSLVVLLSLDDRLPPQLQLLISLL